MNWIQLVKGTLINESHDKFFIFIFFALLLTELVLFVYLFFYFSSTLLDFSTREQLKNDNVGYSKQQEPNIDFELDVKVFINSGKCVLHTKDQTREDELKMWVSLRNDVSKIVWVFFTTKWIVIKDR